LTNLVVNFVQSRFDLLPLQVFGNDGFQTFQFFNVVLVDGCQFLLALLDFLQNLVVGHILQMERQNLAENETRLPLTDPRRSKFPARLGLS
jgi:hypothetical protein